MGRYRIALLFLVAQILIVWAVNSQAEPPACPAYESALEKLGVDYTSSKNSIEFMEKKNYLAGGIEAIEKMVGTGRGSESQYRHNVQEALLEFELTHDNAFVIKERLSPVYGKFYSEFFTLVEGKGRVDTIEGVLKDIKKDASNINWTSLKVKMDSPLFAGEDFKNALEKQNSAELFKAFDSQIKTLKDANIEIAKSTLLDYDDYSATYFKLKQTAEDRSPERAVQMLNAQEALKELQPQYQIRKYAEEHGLSDVPLTDFENVEALKDLRFPSLATIHQVLNHYPEAELALLAYQRRILAIADVALSMPADAIFRFLGNSLSHFNVMVRGTRINPIAMPELQAFFLAIKDKVVRKEFFPYIERIVASTSRDAKSKYQMLKALNAGSHDQLMTTFARRARGDLFEDWKAIKQAAVDAGDTDFTNLAATADQEAIRLGSLSLINESKSTELVAKALSVLVVSYGIYTGVDKWVTGTTVTTSADSKSADSSISKADTALIDRFADSVQIAAYSSLMTGVRYNSHKNQSSHH